MDGRRKDETCIQYSVNSESYSDSVAHMLNMNIGRSAVYGVTEYRGDDLCDGSVFNDFGFGIFLKIFIIALSHLNILQVRRELCFKLRQSLGHFAGKTFVSLYCFVKIALRDKKNFKRKVEF